MDSEIQCPICFEIPENEIYQCEDGHMLCEPCYSGVSQCPQCRVPYGTKKIRCRPMESLLDTMTFPCHHADLGCNLKVKRMEMKTHLSECQFGSKSVRLCELLGFKCDFGTRGRGLALTTAFEHFESSHGFVSLLATSFQVTLENFENVTTDASCEQIIWTPVIFNLNDGTGTPIKFLLIPRINEDDKSFSADALLLLEGDNIKGKDFKVDFQMKHTSSNEVEDISWSRSAVSLRHASAFLNSSILRFPLQLLRKYFMSEGGTLKVNVGVRRTTSAEEQFQNLNVADNPHIFPVRVAMLNENQVVFSDVRCDGCRMRPVVNVLYKCLQCPDYDLCQVCMTKKTHSKHVFALIKTNQHYQHIRKVRINAPGQGFKPIFEAEPGIPRRSKLSLTYRVEVECDGCGPCGFQNLSGIRYTCLQCPDLDLCETCMNRGIHTHHIFGVIFNNTQKNFIDRKRNFNKLALLPKHTD